MKYNLADALEARDKLQERQKWIDEVARPMHPDDERPWANEYITTRQALAKAQEKIERVRKFIDGFKRDCAIDGTWVGPVRLQLLLDALNSD